MLSGETATGNYPVQVMKNDPNHQSSWRFSTNHCPRTHHK
jgi:pyruvate kinase